MMAARSPAERLRMASRMFDMGRTLLRAGLKKRNKTLNEKQLRLQVFLRLYGDDFTGSEIRRIVSSLISRRELDRECRQRVPSGSLSLRL